MMSSRDIIFAPDDEVRCHHCVIRRTTLSKSYGQR
jgi:hypothetical protein